MTTPQSAALPELPEPAHRGPTGTGTYFDSFTADQMRARDAMWAERLATLQAQPAAAGVSDEPEQASKVVNDSCWKFIDAMPHKIPGPIWNDLKPAIYAALIHYHRAILALRPQAVPMTDEVKVAPYSEWRRGDLLRITSEGNSIGPFSVGQIVRHDDKDGDNVPYCRSLDGGYRYALIHDQLEFVSREYHHGITAQGAQGEQG